VRAAYAGGVRCNRELLGSGLNAGNVGAEIDVIKPTLPVQTHAPIAIHFAFGVSPTSFLIPLLTLLQAIFRLCEVHTPRRRRDWTGNES
jgi:hypothetical protein